MDEELNTLPQEEITNTYLLYELEAKVNDANQIITDNMQLPSDSQTEQWSVPLQIIGGEYAGMWCIKKPDEGNPALMVGVPIEIEAEYDPMWFEETE